MIKKFFIKLHTSLDKHPAAFMIVLSLMLNCFIELMGRRSVVSLAVHIATRPHIFLLNTSIITCTFLLAIFAVRRAFAVLLISSFWIICGIINFAVITFRASPFTARDLFLLGYGLRIADVYVPPLLMAVIIVALIALTAGTIIAFIKLPKIRSRPKLTRAICIILPVVALLALLASVAAPGSKDIVTNGVIDAYNDYGFAYCFTSSLLSSGIDKPDNYSMETVSEILAALDNESQQIAQEPASEQPQAESSYSNIIFVQLESFIDPAIVEGLFLPDDPIPTFTNLKEFCPHGYLNVPVVGGGTANVEFEVITGLSSRLFALGECPYDSILRKRGCESIAYNLKDLGYTATAIHNHNGTFYSRNIVYSNLGFDRFIPLEYMSDVSYTPVGWAKDSVLTDYIERCLEATDGPDFVFAVTVQGHGRYPNDFDDYATDVPAILGLDNISPGAVEYYVSQLNETDSFIGELIDFLEDSDEDMTLVLYGDHLPALSLSDDNLTTGSIYQTEYVIWSNFDLDTDTDTENLYSYELTAYVLDMLDIDSGIITKLHQSDAISSDDVSLLTTLGYDMLYGENYANGGDDAYIPTELELGLDRIAIKDAYVDDDGTYIEGENFTAYSVVFLSGQRIETEYVDDGLLHIQNTLSEGDVITVGQSGPDRVVLSYTDEYVIP
ncbi:MAG: LTA synthase family protein [Oscillospiraceae bacterium]|nr:LTA synthase family protein [Oscillospiraceae bacterium]